jgi:hypothetical protein
MAKARLTPLLVQLRQVASVRVAAELAMLGRRTCLIDR